MNNTEKNQGKGRCRGQGRGQGQQLRRSLGKGRGATENAGKGRNNGGGFATGGYCVCAKCGEKVSHQRGVKCTTTKCPKCGHTMVREELLNKKSEKSQ